MEATEEKAGTQGDRQEEYTAESPLRVLYPGESVRIAGRDVWVKPWGVKALMTEVPSVIGSLMGKLAPVYEAVRAKQGNEAILSALMVNAGDELVDFVGKTAGLSPADLEAATAGEFVGLLRAIIRQNGDFFGQVSGLYADLGKPIVSGAGETG